MLGTDFTAWIGRQQQTEDVLEPTRSNALRAALGDAIPLADGAPLPPLYHWLYFWDVQPPRALGPDGHQARGGFLPPVDLPRRMWAAGRISFMQPLHLGERVTRVSSILSVTPKSGRSGRLVFVTVRHELAGANGPALIEEQHIVYRELTSPQASAAPPRAAEPAEATWRHDIIPDSVLLFRYSALTMNGHRIHYDRPFATQDESYPGLVVHGPLQATLLAGLAARHIASPMTEFDFRAQSPCFDGAVLHLCGGLTETGALLWTAQAGRMCMTATVLCAP